MSRPKGEREQIPTVFPRHPLDLGWTMLPRWLRRIIEPKQHEQSRAKARRLRQMERGILNASNMGVTEVRDDSV